MISEAVLSIWKTERMYALMFVICLVALGIASYFENDSWLVAIRIPLSILTFACVTVVIGDFLLLIFRREKLGKFWYLLCAIACVLLGVLSYFGNPTIIVLSAFLIISIILIVGSIKSRLSS